jgi:hypothetical protein
VTTLAVLGQQYTHAQGYAMAEFRSASYSAAKAGVSFGSALAIAISWSTHKSIVWAIIHGFFSWVYVIYFAVTR